CSGGAGSVRGSNFGVCLQVIVMSSHETIRVLEVGVDGDPKTAGEGAGGSPAQGGPPGVEDAPASTPSSSGGEAAGERPPRTLPFPSRDRSRCPPGLPFPGSVPVPPGSPLDRSPRVSPSRDHSRFPPSLSFPGSFPAVPPGLSYPGSFPVLPESPIPGIIPGAPRSPLDRSPRVSPSRDHSRFSPSLPFPGSFPAVPRVSPGSFPRVAPSWNRSRFPPGFSLPGSFPAVSRDLFKKIWILI
uniref:Uncharacterized protein n=1 Tax=Geospiza parvula TaxID=87175 RepID=A0A8U8B4M9_GEOPR